MILYDEASGLYYEKIGDDRASITDTDKKITDITIPERINDASVTEIRKKAFLGCKQLKSVGLPDAVEKVGDWAFAHCDALKDIRIPRTCTFGQGVFKNDNSLTGIAVTGRSEASARLLAKAVTVMDAEYLLDAENAGSREWFGRWDQKLESILELADDDGYHLYVLCGEEDLHFDYEEYLEFNRRKKAGLCMLRLLYDEELHEGLRERITSYVTAHSVGRGSEASWKYILSEHGDDIEYYRLLKETGGIGQDNLEMALNGLSDRHAQAKAFLINSFNTGNKTESFFDALML